jgi:chloramphenicol 3-O phosphotransferase
MTGNIIIINGYSSCGKTSTTKYMYDIINEEIYKKNGNPYIYLDLDSFLKRLPKQWINIERPNQPLVQNPNGLAFKKYIEKNTGKPIIEIIAGKQIVNVIIAVVNTIKAFANTGLNVIFEGGMDTKAMKYFYDELKNNYNAFFVYIHCTLAIAEKREKERKGFIGLTRGQQKLGKYKGIEKYADFTLNTGINTAEKNAKDILVAYNKFLKK